jgi:hypothetical protein
MPMMMMMIKKKKKKKKKMMMMMMVMVMMEMLPFSPELLLPSTRSYCRLPGDVAVIPELLPTARSCCPFARTELLTVC